MANRPQLNGIVSDKTALFIRDMLIYIEFSSAIKAEDIGRIKESLVLITAICQAGGTKNYAYELLHLHCGFTYSWTEQTSHAVMSSWPVNTTGQENRWIPTDLFQEHNNLLIKKIRKAKRSTWTKKHGSMTTSIHSLGRMEDQMETSFGVPYSGTKHATKKADHDISEILVSLRANDILGPYDKDQPLEYHSQIASTRPVTNLVSEGYRKM
ncbi:hypothetical protein BCR41DRAFT_199438 [Lobosporangium transversale]|uniref:DUF6589 domain-containing protein n=1 Tax=Lobosporangium transversale TaxID=64571 RepID=A0A1Y2G8K8_9FUNG|nr:hypothetical protein BCR41DRAFT_199438 [Lobosporangium transversale]ORZ04325.1 hypothetical protein BCR41DRAFT_199438 [Lobosporangium transversale]|eukprot:XP_021876483.1 hypothetical protein BCR41DRAFT_199438 [Lobosporangium transversale]